MQPAMVRASNKWQTSALCDAEGVQSKDEALQAVWFETPK